MATTTNWTGAQVRRAFLDYFISKGHREIGSAGLIPQADPTLLFTNAGMVQFKDVFVGAETRDYTRATSSQKCLRVSGKHNDLEEVGRTARHHTFFEMLGNFSFGDYFKEDAIAFAWELLTKVYGLDPAKLYPTVFRDDDEAFALWETKMGVPKERIFRMGEKDNFWSMGETGPCGPCSEILFDQGPGVGCGKPDCSPSCGCDRYLEIWNLVFMQYNRSADGKLTPLPKPSIDTGMGLERLTALLQGQQSNYHSDLLMPLIDAAAHITGVAYTRGTSESDVSLRVCADHLRAISFLLIDGVTFGNEGRNFVMRRLARRALRHGKKIGMEQPFLYRMVPTLVGMLGGHYTELARKQQYLEQSILREEEQFQRTLTSGLAVLEVMTGKLGHGGILPGKDAFVLHDTYGFPLDLTQVILAERGLTVDEVGYHTEMERQKERSRAATAHAEVSCTLDGVCTVEFTGYATYAATATVQAIMINGARAERVAAGTEAQVVITPCPFYGEKGGQVGDTGMLRTDNVKADVTGARWDGKVLYLLVRVIQGELAVGAEVQALVDQARRRAIERNHTATHLLQAALRAVVGDHIRQAGSLVEPERLRFDFSHFEKLTPEQLRRAEDIVNQAIWDNSAVETCEMSQEQAKQSGALAFFGDKYGQTVRVVKVEGVSSEFCGGCHVRRTGEIGALTIVNESSVAAGVRRIEAVTARGVVARLREREDELAQIGAELKAGGDILGKVKALQEQVKALRDENRKLKTSGGGGAATAAGQAEELAGHNVLVAKLPFTAVQDVLAASDKMVKEGAAEVMFLVGEEADGKPAPLVVRLAGELAKTKQAADLLKAAGAPVAAAGGGRGDVARGSAKQPGNLDAVKPLIVRWLA
ncbi:MAG TPA: alanine--tRNA ligase [bacterium]|nr:alanine--tRNA ligase [bacterium]